MKKIAIITILVLAILTVLSFHVAMERSLLIAAKAKQAEMSAMIQVKKEQAYQYRLGNWVYQNSSKIVHSVACQIVDETMKYDHPLLLLALIQTESEFSPTAKSHKDCIGLGQIRWNDGEKDVWGKALIADGICKEKRDLYDIATNIKASNFILTHELKKSKGDAVQALQGYVGGRHKPYVDKVIQNFLHLSMIKKV